MSRKPILITGHLGLIGQALMALLKQLGISVIGMDNRLNPKHTGYGDIRSVDDLEQRVSQVSGVVHLAAVSRVLWGEQQPELCEAINIVGTRNVLSTLAKQSQPPWFIYASSREVYGQQSTLPVKETATLNPCNTYARTKQSAEDLTHQYQKLGVNCSIVRFSNVYGWCKDHPDRVIPIFCQRALQQQPLWVEGRNNLFDFTHVSDVVRGISLIIEKLSQHQTLPPIHFVTGQGTTLYQAATFAIEAAQSSSDIIDKPSRTFDVARFVGCPSQAKSALDWQPTIMAKDGIAKFVDEFRYFNRINSAATSAAL